jgi:hypothetical protein
VDRAVHQELRTAARSDLLTIRPSRPRPRTWDITDTRSDTQSRPHPTTALQVSRELRRPADRWIEGKIGAVGDTHNMCPTSAAAVMCGAKPM